MTGEPPRCSSKVDLGFFRMSEDADLDVPVHPALEAILADWKERGWKEYFGRDPEPGALICPSLRGDSRSSSAELKYLRKDCVKLGIEEPGVLTGDVQPKRRQHDARTAFINRLEGAGADSKWVKAITHPPQSPRDGYSHYLRENWPKMCEAVLHLKLTPRRREPPPQAEVVGA